MLDEIWKEASIFHNVLQSFRVRRGKSWTQEATAKLLGIKVRKYIGWENGENIPSREELEKIVAVFRLNQEETKDLYLAAWQAPPKICHLPFSRNPFFIDRKMTDRKTYLEQLREFLQENGSVVLTQPVSISGLAGIGKSQLALEYAYRCFPKVYRAVFWANAADKNELHASYDKFAQKLELPEQNEREQDRRVQAVKQWLVDHTNWLLIMDNADNLQLARSFFPEGHQGHILLTTRSQMVGDVAGQIIEIDKMEPEEGLLFLLRRTRMIEGDATPDTVAADIREAAEQLVELLGGLPLALDQAGAYIEDDPLVSFSDYINLYHAKRRDVLSERGSLNEENAGKYSYHPQSVVVTFRLCFEKSHERHPMATDILRFCAFLQPDAIPAELFQHDDTFKLDKTALRKGIIALLRYSLIKPNAQENTYSIHRLVQAVLIDEMPSDLQRQWRERVVQAVNAAFPIVEFKHWRQWERMLPHALVCIFWTENELTPTVVAAELFHTVSVCLHARGQYSVAEELLTRVLSIYKQHFGVEHPISASIMSDLGALYNAQGDFIHAESLYRQALDIQEKHFGTEHPAIAKSLYNLAVLYLDQDEYEIAEPLLVRVLSIQESHLGCEHPYTAFTLSSLAVLYSRQDEDDQAELLFRRAIRIWEKHLDADHPYIAYPLHGLAMLMQDQGKHEQAEALYQRALRIQERQLWSMHPVTISTKINYADFLYSIGREADAAALEASFAPSE